MSDQVLDDEQRSAAYADAARPLVVFAAAGTGKTRILAARAAYLAGRLPPSDGIILVTTFTRRARGEIESRLLATPDAAAERVWVKTLHATGMYLLSGAPQWGARFLGLPRPRVATARQRAEALDAALRAAGLGLPREDLAAAISLSKAGGLPRRTGLTWAQIAAARHAYDDALHGAGTIDVDDMIALPNRAMERERLARREARILFARVLVDEFQDLSRAEARFIATIGGAAGEKISGVGDVAQDIYGFRGADAANMRAFARRLPGATVLHLTRSYRLTRPLVALANAFYRVIVAEGGLGAPGRSDRAGALPRMHLSRTAGGEARYIAAEIERLLARGQVTHRHDIAVLYREGRQEEVLAACLGERGIPCRRHRQTVLAAQPAVVQAMAWLALLADASDTGALLHVLESAGPGLRALVARAGGVWTLPRLWHQVPPGASARQARDLADLLTAHAVLQRLQGAVEPAALFDHVLDRTGLGRRHASADPAAAAHLAALRALYVAADGDIEDVRHQAQEDPTGPTDAVLLSTIHAAKGAEFDVVFVAGLTDGYLPHYRALAGPEGRGEVDELRVLYVAATRASRLLYLCGSCETAGSGATGTPSRFWRLVPRHLVAPVA